jgi:hypothetical protein
LQKRLATPALLHGLKYFAIISDRCVSVHFTKEIS